MEPTVPFWSVEVGDAAVHALRVRRTADNALEVLAAWTAPVPAAADPVKACVEILRRRGLREHGVQVVLPGRGAACRSARIAPEDADLPPREMERDLFDLTPLEPEEAVLRYRRLGGPEVLDYRVVAERKSELLRWERALEEAGFRHFGLSLGPAAVLAALEGARLAPPRGYCLMIRGHWSVLLALEGALTVRYPIPFGIHDVARRLEEGQPRFPLEQALDAPAGSPAAEALAAAAAPLVGDALRAAEFHRASVHGGGDEVLLAAGRGADRLALRSLLSRSFPVPLAPLPALEPGGLLRMGPRMDRESFRQSLPLHLASLGGALTASGFAPRDLDFRHLPEEIPVPRERSLLPLAAGILAAAAGLSLALARETRDDLERGVRAVAAIPEPPPATGPLSPGEAEAEAARLSLLVERARERAALRRALSTLVETFPRADDGAPPSHGTEGFEVLREGGNFRVRLRARVAAPTGDGPAPPAARIDPLLRSLETAGWRVTGFQEGVVTAEILLMKKGTP